jgi:hypothetical protein
MRGLISSFPDYSYYATAQLLAAFADGAARLRAAIDGLTDEECRARPRGPTKWSIHEIVIHVADSEMQGTFRIRKAWSEPSPVLPMYDQDAWVREIDYQGQDAAARERALTLLALLREQTLPLFRRATAEDWEKSGTHPEFGTVTLRNLLELYADHVERHIDQILESRARLGRPLAMPQILPRRLY